MAHLSQRCAPVRIPRKPAVAHEPPGRRVPNEEGCDREVQFIGEVPGEELGVHRLAALDHQPAHAAAVEILAHPLQAHRLAAVDDRRHGPSRSDASFTIWLAQ